MRDDNMAARGLTELLEGIAEASIALDALEHGRAAAGVDVATGRPRLDALLARDRAALSRAFENAPADERYAAARAARALRSKSKRKKVIGAVKSELARRAGFPEVRGGEWQAIAACLPEAPFVDWLWTDVNADIVAALSDRFGGAHPLVERHIARWYPSGGSAAPLVDLLLSVPGRLTAVMAKMDAEARDGMVGLLLAYVEGPPDRRSADGARGNLLARTEALRVVAAAAPHMTDAALSRCTLDRRLPWLLEQAHDSHFEYGASAARALATLASRAASGGRPELVKTATAAAAALLESCEQIAVELPRHRSLVAGIAGLLRWPESLPVWADTADDSAEGAERAVAVPGPPVGQVPSDIASRAAKLLGRWLAPLPKKASNNQRYAQASAIYGLTDASTSELPHGRGVKPIGRILDELTSLQSTYVLAGLTDVYCEVVAAGDRHPWAVAGIEPVERLVSLRARLTHELAASKTPGDTARLLESARLAVETLTLRAGERLSELGRADESAHLDPFAALGGGVVDQRCADGPEGELLSLWVASCVARTARSLSRTERDAELATVKRR